MNVNFVLTFSLTTRFTRSAFDSEFYIWLIILPEGYLSIEFEFKLEIFNRED